MNPVLTRTLNRLGFFREESCGLTPNRLNGKNLENILTSQELRPTATYFFVAPVYTYHQAFIRSLVSFFRLIN